MAPAKKAAAASSSTAPVKATATKAPTKKVVKVAAPATTVDAPASVAVTVDTPTLVVDAVAVAPAVDTPTETAVPATVESVIAAITGHFLTAEKEVRAGKTLLKKLHQLHNKEMKAAAIALKNGARRRRERDPNAPKRAPSGIAKPSTISPELASFLGVTPDTLLARTEVIKHISAYIKANNLENPANRRQIVPNEALAKLLGVPKDDAGDLSYFSIQKQLRPHFPKAVVVV